jgi:hypothetical protein
MVISWPKKFWRTSFILKNNFFIFYGLRIANVMKSAKKKKWSSRFGGQKVCNGWCTVAGAWGNPKIYRYFKIFKNMIKKYFLFENILK